MTDTPREVHDTLRVKAEWGEAAAQQELGIRYLTGRGCEKNATEAAKWIRVAAEQGASAAQTLLGAMYVAGSGVPQDEVQGARWFRVAAELGNSHAQYEIGAMYASGRGVERNDFQAQLWLTLAVTGSHGQDIEKFAKSQEDLTGKLTPQQMAEVERRAREWKPKAWDELKNGLAPAAVVVPLGIDPVVVEAVS